MRPGSPRPAESEPVPAGVVTRTLAALVDLVVVLVMMGGTLLVVAGLRFVRSPFSFRWPAPSWPVSLWVGALIATSYLTVAWATSGRTCGAALFGLRVGSVGGELLGWLRAGLRAALYVAFPPGLLWVAVSRRRRSLQDAVVFSVVVYDRDDPHSPRTDGARRRAARDRPAVVDNTGRTLR